MGAIASQTTSLTIVNSTVYSDADQRKHQSSASLAFVTGEFPAQMASNAENVSIWWRHHVKLLPRFPGANELMTVTFIDIFILSVPTQYRDKVVSAVSLYLRRMWTQSFPGGSIILGSTNIWRIVVNFIILCSTNIYIQWSSCSRANRN